MATACEAHHANEAELVYLKQALDANPKDIEVNRHCARSLGRMGQFDQAIACWHRIETLRGQDSEAARMISQLAEEKLRYPGGIPPTPAAPAPAKAVAVDQPQATASTAEPSLTPRQVLERAVGYNPQDERLHLRLADELIASAEYEEAERRLQQALIACDGSQPLLEKLEQVRTLLAQQRQNQAEAALHAHLQPAERECRTPWLELLLVTAMLALVLQFFPALGTTLGQVLDFRNWGRGTWFVVNVLILLFLCSLRFFPELLRSFRRKHVRS
jgi:Flp pilus assembly protein TadD